MLGNFGDMMKLMSKAKDIQEGMKTFKAELPGMEFSATGADGRVRVTVSGDLVVKKVEVTEAALADREQLETDLAFAFNAASSSAKLALQERLRELTGGIGLDLPGLF